MQLQRTRRFLLSTIIFVLLLSHLYVASFRTPYPAAIGSSIHAPSQWKEDTVDTIRVSTYNIHRGKGKDGDHDIHRIASLLADDDISGLQEVMGNHMWSNQDQVQNLASILDTGWLFAPIQKRYYHEHLGNGLLSRLPITRWYIEPLIWSNKLDDSKQSFRYRNVIQADLKINGYSVKLFVTHLDRGEIRNAQLQFVLKKLEKYEHAILMADLNSNKNTFILSQWLKQNPNSDVISQALGAKDSTLRVDWILVKGFTLIQGGLAPIGASDHPYYWVDLKLS